MIAELASAATLGILTAISPCPLATNIAAVSFLGRHVGSPRRSLLSGLLYVAGRTLGYTVLAAALTAGLLAAASTSSALGRTAGLLVGPVLLVAGGMVLGWIPAPSWGSSGRALTERLAQRGDGVAAFLMGVLFALSFCPSSAALFFGSLIPLATRAQSTIAVPVAFGAATGMPVLAFAVLVATGSHGVGRYFDRIQSVERWLRAATGAILVLVGLYLCLESNLGL